MKYVKLFEQFIEDQVLNELDLKTYANAIKKAQGRGAKQRKNIEKLALKLIKRGDTEEVKDKRKTVHKIELPNGDVEYRNDKGQLHREDGPAVETADGDKYWYRNGKLHREDGPAIVYSNSDKLWYLNGQQHREDGPAVEFASGTKAWYLNGQRHREDGPARELSNGTKEWYLNDKQLTQEEFNKKVGNK